MWDGFLIPLADLNESDAANSPSVGSASSACFRLRVVCLLVSPSRCLRRGFLVWVAMWVVGSDRVVMVGSSLRII